MLEQPFVGRERELAQLDAFLARALAGQGQVCFLVGEAGSGKTALVGEFARRAQEAQDELVVAVGQGDAQTGAGDAYLPFREVLQQLTGDVEGKLGQGAITQENAGRLRKMLRFSGQALVELGPDLVGIFVPGGGLLLRAGAFVAEKVGWLDKLEKVLGRSKPAADLQQDHILEQYTNVLRAVAEKKPLLLVLDDLQWADSGSLELLFRLGRRIGDSHVLIVGTYRPDEVAPGRAGARHPLEKVLAEFKRYLGEIELDLRPTAAEGRRFVDALLDASPNRLGDSFRQSLFAHTGGHPLFTVELLHALEERGALARDTQGRWMVSAALDWQVLPARVEGVIEERVGRLEPVLRQLLVAASVEGETFTAEAVARALGVEERVLVRQLSGELEKQHELVSAQGTQRVGEQRLSRYQFRHSLFQRYLYNALDEVERSYLHEDIGNALEGLWGERAGEITVQLARHFVEAQDAVKARLYLRLAGEQAAARFANAAAVDYYSQALKWTPAEDAAGRLELLLAREKIYDLQGLREPQSQDLAEAERLAGALGDTRRQSQVALRRGYYALAAGDLAAGAAAARQVVDMGQASGDRAAEANGHLLWGSGLWPQNEYRAALEHYAAALSLARAAGARREEARSLHNLGIAEHYLGELDSAWDHTEQALDLYEAEGERQGQGMALNNLGGICKSRGDYAGAAGRYQEALHFYRQIGDRSGEKGTLSNLAVVAMAQGYFRGARDYLQEALRAAREVQEPRDEALALMRLGNSWAEESRPVQARACYEEAQAICQRIGDRDIEGNLLGNIAIVAHRQGDYATAESYYTQCLATARQSGDRGIEAMTLAYQSLLLHHLGRDEAALQNAERALALARDLGARPLQAQALVVLGHALAGRGRLEEALAAYRQALELWRALGQKNLALEALAGLARVELTRGNGSPAQEHVEEILGYLESKPLAGVEEPMRIYLTCYRVLQASGDARTAIFLRVAQDELRERAARIDDPAARQLFLEQVAANRELLGLAL
jgi:tetratricopeptide (TPR) repeat protein